LILDNFNIQHTRASKLVIVCHHNWPRLDETRYILKATLSERVKVTHGLAILKIATSFVIIHQFFPFTIILKDEEGRESESQLISHEQVMQPEAIHNTIRYWLVH